MLKVVRENERYDNKGLAFYEIGTVFRKEKEGLEESLHLGIMLTGSSRPEDWVNDSREYDFFDLKGIVEMFLERFNVDKVSFEQVSEDLDEPLCLVKVDSMEFGRLGKIPKSVADSFDISKEAFFFEADITGFTKLTRAELLYEPLPRFKYVERDVSLLIDADSNAWDIMQFIRSETETLCKDVTVFDSFTGSPLPRGKRNLGLRLSFQPRESNLTKDELDEVIKNLAGKLAARYNATLRGREADGS
jgi:phenylalanyl-tRNA synthetase beta chain